MSFKCPILVRIFFIYQLNYAGPSWAQGGINYNYESVVLLCVFHFVAELLSNDTAIIQALAREEPNEWGISGILGKCHLENKASEDLPLPKLCIRPSSNSKSEIVTENSMDLDTRFRIPHSTKT